MRPSPVPSSPADRRDALARILEAAPGRSGRDIAATIARLVRTGVLPDGTRLPTVRALAAAVGTSTAQVSAAWRLLADHGLIRTHRRRGTVVVARDDTPSGRFWRVPVGPGGFRLDLSTGTPDPALLPPLGPALATVPARLAVSSYLDPPVVPELADLLMRRWPFTPERLTVVDGALDALDRLIRVRVRLGDTVCVEDPTFAPILDLLELAGARVVGLDLDDEGIRPEALATALAADPVLVVLQPRAHNPTGISMSEERAARLAELVRGRDLIVVEDDHSGPVAGAPGVSLGRHVPDQVVHVSSFSKSHGPDLRLAAVGGATDPLDEMERRRRLGPSWSSRLLQRVLSAMLTDPATEAAVSAAGRIYRRRRAALAAALAERGVAVAPGSGLNLWVPVADEQRAMVRLASEGIGVAPGSAFRVRRDGSTDHVRVTTATLDGGVDELADLLAAAARGPA